MSLDAATVNLMHCAGQMLNMVHYARGLDNDGILQVDTFANGEIPNLPDGAKIVLMPYEEDLIQTGPGIDVMFHLSIKFLSRNSNYHVTRCVFFSLFN